MRHQGGGLQLPQRTTLGRGPGSITSSALLKPLRSAKPPPRHLDRPTDIYQCVKGCDKKYESTARWRYAEGEVWERVQAFISSPGRHCPLLHMFTNLELLSCPLFKCPFYLMAIISFLRSCSVPGSWNLHGPILEFVSMDCSFLYGLQTPFFSPSNNSLTAHY